MNWITEEHEYFLGTGGLKLFFRSHRVNNPQAVLIGVHGLGEHSGRYLNFINFFNQRNFSLYFFDLPGHGLSAGARGHILNFNEYLLDLKEFCNLVTNKETNRNIFLVGHSLGGLIVLRYIQEFGQNLKGAVFSSPALKSLIPNSAFKIYLINILSDILPEFSLFNRINPSYLSRNGQVVENYKKDKLVHHRISVRCFTEINRAMLAVYRRVSSVKLPCLMLQAGGDKIVSPLALSTFFKHLKVPQKRLNIYSGFYHELFNEPENEKVFTDIYNWVIGLT